MEAVRSDFETFFAERYAVTGDATLAKKQAIERLADPNSGAWGVTDSGSEKRLMRYPPEYYYKKVRGSHDWMADDVEATVREWIPDARSWGITEAFPETSGAVGTHRLPVYWLWALDENGMFRLKMDDTGYPALVSFDFEMARQKALDAYQKQQSDMIDWWGTIEEDIGRPIEYLERKRALEAQGSHQ
jgi:hypothetical protein